MDGTDNVVNRSASSSSHSDSNPAAGKPARTSASQPRKDRKARFRHGIDVYHRILHDILPAHDFELGYEDRFDGIMWMAVEHFRNTGDEVTEIPFHRVRMYRYKGEIVWDRDRRIDVLDEIYQQAR